MSTMTMTTMTAMTTITSMQKAHQESRHRQRIVTPSHHAARLPSLPSNLFTTHKRKSKKTRNACLALPRPSRPLQSSSSSSPLVPLALPSTSAATSTTLQAREMKSSPPLPYGYARALLCMYPPLLPPLQPPPHFLILPTLQQSTMVLAFAYRAQLPCTILQIPFLSPAPLPSPEDHTPPSHPQHPTSPSSLQLPPQQL